MLAIGIDVGGTKLAAGLVAPDGTIVERLRRDTPDDGDAVTDEIVDAAHVLAARHGLARVPVGVGAAGLIDRDGSVRYAPNIDWADYPLGAKLAAALGTAVTVDNDANVAAWGEFRVGAGTHARTSLVMLTIGTGVGGGVVLHGALVRGAHGLAGELGHMTLDPAGPVCACGVRGHLEALASGTAIGRAAQEALAAGDVPADSRLHHLDALTGKSVTVAAHAGDAAAAAIVRRCGYWLGVGIASLVNALDPEIVVLGGGAMQAGDLLLEPARAAAAEHVVGGAYRPRVPVVRAQLADDAGLVGAALLALDEQP